MLTLNFKTPKEIENELSNNCLCVALMTINGATELIEDEISFLWVEYDPDGNETGSTTLFQDAEAEHFKLGDRLDSEDTYEVLEWFFDGKCSKDIGFIIRSDEYNNAMDIAEKDKDKS